MPREKLPPNVMQECLAGDLVPEVASALQMVDEFLNSYEMTAGVVQNLQGARKHLLQAVALSKAAQVIAAV